MDLPTREEVALFAVPHARLRFAWRHLAEDHIVQRSRAKEQAVGGIPRLGRCGGPSAAIEVGASRQLSPRGHERGLRPPPVGRAAWLRHAGRPAEPPTEKSLSREEAKR